MKAIKVFMVPLLLLTSCAPQMPPPGALTAVVDWPEPGTVWLVRRDGQPVQWERLPDGIHKGRPVIRIQVGRRLAIFDQVTKNWIADLEDDRVVEEAIPSQFVFSSPLWIGKNWSGNYVYRNHRIDRTWDLGEWWEVVAYEDVTVPAGTYRAFRLRSTPGANNAGIHTVWWAPEIKLIVKRTYERRPDHYQGPGLSTSELIRYWRK